MKYTLDNTVFAGVRLEVELNGSPVTDWLECDDEAGYVIKYRRLRGKLLHNDGELILERLTGAVEVTQIGS